MIDAVEILGESQIVQHYNGASGVKPDRLLSSLSTCKSMTTALIGIDVSFPFVSLPILVGASNDAKNNNPKCPTRFFVQITFVKSYINIKREH